MNKLGLSDGNLEKGNLDRRHVRASMRELKVNLIDNVSLNTIEFRSFKQTVEEGERLHWAFCSFVRLDIYHLNSNLSVAHIELVISCTRKRMLTCRKMPLPP